MATEVGRAVANRSEEYASPLRLVKSGGPGRGLNRAVVEEISWSKGEPEWLRRKRLESLAAFESMPMPTWGPDLSGLDFDQIQFYAPPGSARAQRWEDVPEDVRRVYDQLGIPEAEQKFLAGVVAVRDQEPVYEHLKRHFAEQGILFTSMDTAVTEYPELVQEYFMKRNVPVHDNKFAALHGAVWSGGSFVYVPQGVKVGVPVQAYFRIEGQRAGTFEHTLIIAEPDSEVHYIEGCTAQQHSTSKLHSAVVEVFAKDHSRIRYTTVQNWSKDVYNLNTKRALVLGEEATMEWVGGSLGSGVTMLYPASILLGRRSRADHLNISVAGRDQRKDTGAKVIHAAPQTSSRVVSKSISADGGWTTYRGLVRVTPAAVGAKVNVRCDALILDDQSRSDTWPDMQLRQSDVTVEHEAAVGRISEEQVFYLMSRGIKESEARTLIVNGFIEPVAKELPLEYAVELNRLIQMEIAGDVG